VDMQYFNKEVYSILSMLCEGDALQTIKNLREDFHGRGFRAWYQLTREVAGKSGVRLERLADRVHKPKVITDYKLGHAMLTKWDADVKEIAKLDGQQISDLTKRNTLKNMIPPDLQRDLEKDRSLKTFAPAWNYVMEQVLIRKEWKSSSGKRGKDDMDVDVAEGDEDTL